MSEFTVQNAKHNRANFIFSFGPLQLFTSSVVVVDLLLVVGVALSAIVEVPYYIYLKFKQ